MTRTLLSLRPLAAIAALLILAACASTAAADAAREAAYRQCLEDNMAVATAWKAIEQSCRERANGDDHPLDYYPPQED
jgi:hypothetical protein